VSLQRRATCTHQPSDDFDGALVASVAASADEHGQEEGDEKMLPDQSLISVQYKGRAGLKHQEAEQPPPAAGLPASGGSVLHQCPHIRRMHAQ